LNINSKVFFFSKKTNFFVKMSERTPPPDQSTTQTPDQSTTPPVLGTKKFNAYLKTALKNHMKAGVNAEVCLQQLNAIIKTIFTQLCDANKLPALLNTPASQSESNDLVEKMKGLLVKKQSELDTMSRSLESQEENHNTALDRARQTHASALAKEKNDNVLALAKEKNDNVLALTKEKNDNASALAKEKNDHASALENISISDTPSSTLFADQEALATAQELLATKQQTFESDQEALATNQEALATAQELLATKQQTFESERAQLQKEQEDKESGQKRRKYVPNNDGNEMYRFLERHKTNLNCNQETPRLPDLSNCNFVNFINPDVNNIIGYNLDQTLIFLRRIVIVGHQTSIKIAFQRGTALKHLFEMEYSMERVLEEIPFLKKSTIETDIYLVDLFREFPRLLYLNITKTALLIIRRRIVKCIRSNSVLRTYWGSNPADEDPTSHPAPDIGRLINKDVLIREKLLSANVPNPSPNLSPNLSEEFIIDDEDEGSQDG